MNQPTGLVRKLKGGKKRNKSTILCAGWKDQKQNFPGGAPSLNVSVVVRKERGRTRAGEECRKDYVMSGGLNIISKQKILGGKVDCGTRKMRPKLLDLSGGVDRAD